MKDSLVKYIIGLVVILLLLVISLFFYKDDCEHKIKTKIEATYFNGDVEVFEAEHCKNNEIYWDSYECLVIKNTWVKVRCNVRAYKILNN